MAHVYLPVGFRAKDDRGCMKRSITFLRFPIDFIRLSCGRKVTIVLKNGDTLTGLLCNLDGYMNLKIKNCTLCTKNGHTRKLEEVYILGVEIMNIKVPNVVVGEAARIENSRKVFKNEIQKKGVSGEKSSPAYGSRRTQTHTHVS